MSDLPRNKNPLYQKWRDMVRRCTDPRVKGYASYGGRGVKVCARWVEDFDQFARDMGPLPTPAHQLDRKNNDGNYEPSNCRWVTGSKNAANRASRGNRTGFRSVHSHYNRYKAEIRCEQTRLRIGHFETADEAAWAYDSWSLSLFGSDAYANFDYVELGESSDKS